MLGLNRYEVAVHDANADWAQEYREMASQIRAAAQGLELAIEHIGSTSVPGLDAKPIIDVGVLLSDLNDFASLRKALASIDLIYRGDKGSTGGQLFVRESEPEVRTHHVHVYSEGAPEWNRYLVFRDRLRASAALRTEYGALKRRLVRDFSRDRFAYMEGKTEFVSTVLADC